MFGFSLTYTYLCRRKDIAMSKNLYIISGCNGAGKTTASFTVLPEVLECREFVNADEIARGLSPFNPESVAIEAGRLMLQRIEDLLDRGESFHNIPEPILRRRYIAGIKNLFSLFMPVVDYWDIYINSSTPRVQIACGGKNAETIIYEEYQYQQIQEYVK